MYRDQKGPVRLSLYPRRYRLPYRRQNVRSPLGLARLRVACGREDWRFGSAYPGQPAKVGGQIMDGGRWAVGFLLAADGEGVRWNRAGDLNSQVKILLLTRWNRGMEARGRFRNDSRIMMVIERTGWWRWRPICVRISWVVVRLSWRHLEDWEMGLRGCGRRGRWRKWCRRLEALQRYRVCHL